MMTVVGVIDLRGGLAVRACGGRRDRYAPVRATSRGPLAEGDAMAVARFYLDECGIQQLYVADLDALAGLPAQRAAVGALAGLGAPLWLDAGTSTPDQARRWLSAGVARVIVGLETLVSFDALHAVGSATGRERMAFSLDLRDGRPLAGADDLRSEDVESLARRAAGAGAGSLIVLDVARVGTGAGVNRELLSRVRAAAPGVALYAAGGVRDAADLELLADAGCEGALVATALLDGRLKPPFTRGR